MNEATVLARAQRNPTALFGAGLIDRFLTKRLPWWIVPRTSSSLRS